ncbi:DM9 repeat-containing protein [Plantactinospora sonchi]|uniref:DM9 repeat-containing protein n=1 Tax=Plantactinospora sonchi TaxID=1544735 RepID=A0ABU7RWZ2_9ACTN
MDVTADAYRWEPACGGRIPPGAVPHGYEADGEPLWVCRVRMYGGVHPGKVRPGFGAAQVAWNGREVSVDEYEVLMDRGVWGIASGGAVPADALPAGREGDGEPLYVARSAVAPGTLHIGKVRSAFGAANIGYGTFEHKVFSYEVLLDPSLSSPPEATQRAGIQMPPTYADFGTEPPRIGNVTVTGVDRASAAGDHLAIGAGGSVELRFDVPDPAVVREACVAIVALASMLSQAPGYAPLTVRLNGRALADRLRIPNGGGLPQRLVFAVPAEELVTGWNTLRIESGADALSLLWLYRVTIDPMHAHDQAGLALERQAIAEPVLRYASGAGEITIFVDRGEQAVLDQVAWADASGAEYAITFEKQQAAFYGWRRQPGEPPSEFRGQLIERGSFAEEARRFSTEEGWSGGWHHSGDLLVAVGVPGLPVTRLTWRDGRGNNGTVAFDDDGFLGTYQRAGEGPIGYRSRTRTPSSAPAEKAPVHAADSE